MGFELPAVALGPRVAGTRHICRQGAQGHQASLRGTAGLPLPDQFPGVDRGKATNLHGRLARHQDSLLRSSSVRFQLICTTPIRFLPAQGTVSLRAWWLPYSLRWYEYNSPMMKIVSCLIYVLLQSQWMADRRNCRIISSSTFYL